MLEFSDIPHVKTWEYNMFQKTMIARFLKDVTLSHSVHTAMSSTGTGNTQRHAQAPCKVCAVCDLSGSIPRSGARSVRVRCPSSTRMCAHKEPTERGASASASHAARGRERPSGPTPQPGAQAQHTAHEVTCSRFLLGDSKSCQQFRLFCCELLIAEHS